MPGAAHGIIGDDSFLELPQTVVAEQDLTAERSAAKFSRTREFKVLKTHLEARIVHYQDYLPNGALLSDLSPSELGARWAVANAVIAEFKAVIAAYEQAAAAVEDASGH